jgi:hypothetical protein
MTRAFDFTVVAVIYIMAVIIHLMTVELMAPGTPLYELAIDGTEAMSGQEWADQTYMILSTWVPLIAFGGITAWATIREYRRQALSAVRPVQ